MPTNKNLKKVDEEHKIYYDKNTNEFKRMAKCCDCGVDVCCMCYESKDEAIFGYEDEEFLCSKCYILQMFDEDELSLIVDSVVPGSNILEWINKRIETYNMKEAEMWDKNIKDFLKSLTKEQAEKIMENAHDLNEFDYSEYHGSVCKL